ncbi:MAG: TIR domain-containing protein [Chloroflexota bacterium]|nr:TIR domain-containing protein [Chloroflexota bacterium]
MPNAALPRVFISYRREWYTDARGREDRRTPDIVHQVRDRIAASGKFDPYFDRNIVGGKAWADDILDNLKATDVVVVLIQSVEADASITDKDERDAYRARHDTGWSDWVQREIDLARGERIAIYPIILNDATGSEIDGSLQRLALTQTQYIYLPAMDHAAAWKDIFAGLSAGVELTYSQQRARLRQLQERLANPPNIPPYTHKASFPFTYQGAELPISLSIGSGDIARVRAAGVTAIVTSENNYMQMARFHESQTVSGRVRIAGARKQGLNVIVDDLVQRELDSYFTNGDGRATSDEFPALYPHRPVGIGEVLVTHGGHPASELAKQGVRYIFHAASVKFDEQNGLRTVRPIAVDDLVGLMESCLDAVSNLNEAGGLPPDRFPAWNSSVPAPYKPIERIIIPLFGTGHAGADVSDVIPRMLQGISGYIRFNYNQPHFSLKEIHICVLTSSDLDALADQVPHFTDL